MSAISQGAPYTSPSSEYSAERQFELDAVVQTAALQKRLCRPPDYEAENRALVDLAQVLANPPRDILQRLVEVTLGLCHAGSAGISIIEDYLGAKVFRWHALAGELAAYRWGTTPRDFSPCGIVIDRNAVQLMHLPERHFLYLANVKPQVVEVLLVPFSVYGQPVGTIWVVAHEANREFDAEDERLVRELARFAAEAYQLASSVAASKLSDRRKDEFITALARELRCTPVAQGGLSEANGRQLQSMKRVILDVLDRSRSNLEEILAASALRSDGFAGDDEQERPVGRPSRSLGSGNRRAHVRHVRPANGAAATGAPDAASLLRRMRGGDEHALEQLYDCTALSVYTLAQAILRNAEDAEEVVCDTYAQAWRQSERFDAERASPVGWLMMLCRSRAIDRLRQNRSRGASRSIALESVREPADDALSPEEVVSLFHSGSRIQAALTSLSPQRLKLVGLAFFEGLTFAEMAERTGLPLGTVKSHVRRALVELRRSLRTSG